MVDFLLHFLFSISLPTRVIYPFLFLPVFSHIIPLTIALLKSVLSSDFGESTRDSGLNVTTNFVLYEKRDDGFKAEGSTTIPAWV